MKNQWPFWVFIVGIVAIVLFTLNRPGSENAVSLSEIFPQEDTADMFDIEYEFAGKEESGIEETAAEPIAKSTVSGNTQSTSSANTVAAASNTGDAKFTIQTSSYKDKTRAQLALKEMQESGHSAYIKSKDLGAKGIWHRIYVGSFSNKDQAVKHLSTLKKDFKDSFITSFAQ